MKSKKLIILVAGGTSSGKTLFAKKYAKNHPMSTMISLDNYYKELSEMPKHLDGNYNFDHPNSFDFKKLFSDVKDFIDNKDIRIPIYDYQKAKIIKYKEVKNTNVLIIEGIYALYYKDLVNLATWKVFLDMSSDIRLIRRVKRDSQKRGYGIKEIFQNWKNIQKMHRDFVYTTREIADIIIYTDKESKIDKIINLLK